MEVRGKLYELLSHCIPPTIIIKVGSPLNVIEHVLIYTKTIAERIVERVDEALKADVMHWAAIYVRLADKSGLVKFTIVYAGGAYAHR